MYIKNFVEWSLWCDLYSFQCIIFYQQKKIKLRKICALSVWNDVSVLCYSRVLNSLENTKTQTLQWYTWKLSNRSFFLLELGYLQSNYDAEQILCFDLVFWVFEDLVRNLLWILNRRKGNRGYYTFLFFLIYIYISYFTFLGLYN